MSGSVIYGATPALGWGSEMCRFGDAAAFGRSASSEPGVAAEVLGQYGELAHTSVRCDQSLSSGPLAGLGFGCHLC